MDRMGCSSMSSTIRTARCVHQVKVTRQNTTTAVVSDGLKEGEKVVTTGQFLLQPGAIVAIDSGRGS